ncbi:ATP-binding cassette domain-containing protein [Lactobacillus sp. ESL0791]|nr:ATP-binding cassette domain-containing protein [Lactobacillus sp. ESL0791]
MPSKKEIPFTANSDISLNHISYTYPQKDKTTLNNLAFSFKNKGKYILTGDSAAGKSTLLNIISGLIKNYHGKIFLGKQDYHDLSDRQFHQQISYVLQNPYIFNASLRWNLTLGEDFSIAELDRVIKKCDLTATVAKLPQGLNTMLDSKGYSLSGGQKQCIAFARALLRKTPIYLLDEATSSLDKEASTQLEKQILTDPGKTVIMVTHHLQKDIANLADQVVDLQKINS